MIDSDDNNLCFKFCNFTMKLFHLLGFTKELVFHLSSSVTRFNLLLVCFLDGSRFFKKPVGILCRTFNSTWAGLSWKSQDLGRGGGLVGRRWIKHAVSQKIFAHFTWSFLHILYWQHGISVDKKIDKCHFCHHLMTSS